MCFARENRVFDGLRAPGTLQRLPPKNKLHQMVNVKSVLRNAEPSAAQPVASAAVRSQTWFSPTVPGKTRERRCKSPLQSKKGL